MIISCGYSSDVRLPVEWKIDGVSYNELALENTYGYHLNNKSNPEGYSLTISSVRYTTAIQCGICSPPRYSAVGTVTAVGTYLYIYSMHVCIFTLYHMYIHTYIHSNMKLILKL